MFFWIVSDPKLNIYFVFLLARLKVCRVIFAALLLKNQWRIGNLSKTMLIAYTFGL